MRTPAEIAAEIATRPATEIENTDLQELLMEAIEADRAQRGTEVLLTVARSLYEIDEDLDEPMRTLDPEVHARLGEILNHDN